MSRPVPRPVQRRSNRGATLCATNAWLSPPLPPRRGNLNVRLCAHRSPPQRLALPHRSFRGAAFKTRASAAPRDFVRVAVSPDGAVLLQTKVTQLSRTDTPQCPNPQSIDLYSLVHFGDAAYYAHINQLLRDPAYDAVLFELIANDAALSRNPRTGRTRIICTVSPTPSAVARARLLSAVPQVGSLRMSAYNFWVADLSRAEVERLQRPPLHAPGASRDPVDAAAHVHPRWGDRALRLAVCTMLFTLPCPELHVFVFGVWGKLGVPALLALFPLVRGDVRAARRLLFAQDVAQSTIARANTRLRDPVTAARNLEVVRTLQRAPEDWARVAVVYGAWHGDNLCRLFENELGMQYVSANWLTAMEVEEARYGAAWSGFWSRVSTVPQASAGAGAVSSRSSAHVPFEIIVIIVSCILGLEIYGAIDWIHQIAETVLLLEARTTSPLHQVTLDIAAYVVRHGAVLVILRRWLGPSDAFVRHL